MALIRFGASFVMLVLIGNAKAECPTSYTAVDRDCYSLSNETLSWIEATKKCQLEEAVLASFESEMEVNALLNHIDLNEGFLVSSKFWVGMAAVAGKWIWTSNGRSGDLYMGITDTKPEVDYCMTFFVYTAQFSRRLCSKKQNFLCKIKNRNCF